MKPGTTTIQPTLKHMVDEAVELAGLSNMNRLERAGYGVARLKQYVAECDEAHTAALQAHQHSLWLLEEAQVELAAAVFEINQVADEQAMQEVIDGKDANPGTSFSMTDAAVRRMRGEKP